MMINRLRLHRLRSTLAVLAFAPAASLLGARVIAAAVGGADLGGALPVGIHTYVPAVDLVSLQWLELGSLALAFVGLLLSTVGAGHPAGLTSQRTGGVLRVAATLVVAQAVIYGGESLLVAQVQGLPDSGLAVALALLLQGVLVLAVALSWSGLRGLMFAGAIALDSTILAGAAPALTVASNPAYAVSASWSAPRRGPPILRTS